jgi:hypothetical protein
MLLHTQTITNAQMPYTSALVATANAKTSRSSTVPLELDASIGGPPATEKGFDAVGFLWSPQGCALVLSTESPSVAVYPATVSKVDREVG